MSTHLRFLHRVPRPALSTNRQFRAIVVLALAVTVLACAGCSRARPETVQADLTPVMAQLGDGHSRDAAERLLGHAITPAVWQRTGQMVLRVIHRDAVAQAAACARNLVALSEALEMHRADEEHPHLPERLADVANDCPEGRLPVCPAAAGQDTYSRTFRPDYTHGTFRLACYGSHHRAAGLPTGYPRLNSRWELATDDQVPLLWWPDRYEASVTKVEMHKGRATVTVHETAEWRGTPPTQTDCSLPLVAVKQGGATTWVLAADASPDLTGVLGSVLIACREVEAHPASPEATRAECERRLQRTATALEMWSCDHDGNYPTRLSLLVPEYLPRLPSCPMAGDGRAPGYQISPDRSVYDLTCGDGHKDVHVSNRSGRTSAAQSVLLGRPPAAPGSACR